nr:LysR family transcriptional regulator [uncultured Methylophaga sp.]
MDKFESMKRFVTVAQVGSFTRAAEILGLPKSSVSASIKSLEQQINTRLLQRSTRQINLTRDGERYLTKCLSILEQVDSLDSEFQEPSLVSGCLHVDMPSRFAANILLPHLNSWYERYPDISIKLRCNDQRADLIKDGVDCVIRAGHLGDSDLVARPLTQLPVINCVSADYAEKYGKPQSVDDLAHHYLIDYAQNLQTQTAVFEHIAQHHLQLVEMQSRLQVNNTDAYLYACLSGLGIAQLPAMSAEPYLARGELVEILSEYPAPVIPLSIIYASRRQVPKRLSLFMAWLQELTNNAVKTNLTMLERSRQSATK